MITETRLPDIDPVSLSLHKALHYFRPYDTKYASAQYKNAFNWEELSRPGQPLVKLVDLAGGNPLILIHGASGSVVSFMTLQQTFTTSLWALQSTPDTPMHSIEAMAEFYYKAIKNARQ